MPDFIGDIEVPEASNVGTYPLLPDYGSGEAIAPEVRVHQFGSGEEKREQRFYLGTGARRFTLQHSSVTLDELQDLRDLFSAAKGGEGEFTYNAPNQDGTTTAYTCRFENAPLVWEHEATPSARVSVGLIGVPTSAPTYTLNATNTRFPGGTLAAALLAQVQQLIPLVKITVREPGYDVIYLSDRRCTVGSQLYQARLLDWTGISQALDGEADQASFRFGNADRVMRDLAEDTDLWRAKIEFSVFHVGTGIKLDFWTGEVKSFSAGEQIDFVLQAADNLYELRETYPTRFITRTCWKQFDDGVNCPYTANGIGSFVDCDKSPGACAARGMTAWHGGINVQPQGLFNIKNNGEGAGRRRISPYSVVSDSIYGQPLQEIYTDSDMPVNCQLAAGREESDFYTGMGIIGGGPIGAFGSDNSKHLLDGQPMHPGFSPRFGAGHDPAQDNDPSPDSDQFSLDPHDGTMAAGVAFAQIRRSDPPGVQLSKITEHTMQVVVTGGLGGWYWTGPTTRAWSNTITNPIWIALNVFLRAKGMFAASAGTQEALVDTASAIAAAAICNDVVAVVVGAGTETQFKFRGVIADAKPLKDWLTEILKNCLGYYTNANGKLKFGIRVNSSAVEAFEAGNVILGSIQLAPIQPRFNDVTVAFADSEYDFQTNTVNIYDQVHVERYGRVGNGSTINLAGTFTKSQAARIATTYLREEIGGITQAEWLVARRVALKTTALALAVEPGMVCSLTHPDMPGGYGEFRVTRWSLNPDWSVDIEGSPTADSMYDLAIGPKPADVAASAPPTPRVLDRVPGDVQPISGNDFVIDSETEDGINVIHEISYSPPGTDSSDIGVFSGVFAWIEAPNGSGKVYPSGSWDYDGDPDGVGAARYGHIQLKSPQPVGGETWRILLASKSPFYQKPYVLSGTGATPSRTSVIGAQSILGAAPNQLTSPSDFTVTTPNPPLPDSTGVPYKPYVVTVTSPPGGLPADAYLSLFAFDGPDPATDNPVKIGLNYSNPWNGTNVTDPMEVWFQQGATTPTVYLFPVIQAKSAPFVQPTSSFANQSITIPVAANLPTTNPGQIANASHWTFTVTPTAEGDGQQWAKIAITINTLPSGLPTGAYPSFRLFTTNNPATGTPVIGYGGPVWSWVDFAQAMEVWVRMTATSQAVYGFLTIDSPTVTAIPNSGFVSKAITIPALNTAPALSAFSVVMVTPTYQGGVLVSKFQASVTPPNGAVFSEYLIQRIAMNSSFTAALAGSEWRDLFHVYKPAGWTTGAILDTQGDYWQVPGNLEYWRFQAIPVYLDGTQNIPGVLSFNVTVSANTGLHMGQANTATLDTTFDIVAGKIGVKVGTIDNTFFPNGTLGADLTKWASGKTPVNVFAGLPTLPNAAYPSGSVLVNISDGKVYRTANGTTWDKGVAPGDLVAGTIAAGVVYAGTVNASQVNAGTLNAFTITAANISGSSINSSTGGSTITLNGGILDCDNGGPVTARLTAGAFRISVSGTTTALISSINIKLGHATLFSRGVEMALDGSDNGQLLINATKVLGVQQPDPGTIAQTDLQLSTGSTTADSATGNLYNAIKELRDSYKAMRAAMRAHGLIS